MSKDKKAGKYDHVTPALVKQVADVLAEAEGHKYSVSRVFAAYNAVMQKRDKPQTCSSCLRNRVRDLKKWAAEYEKATTPKAGKLVDMPLGENIGDAAPDTVGDTDNSPEDDTAAASTEDAPHGSTFEFIQPGHAELVADDQAIQAAEELPEGEALRILDEYQNGGQDEAPATTEEEAAPAVEDKPATTEPQYVDASAPGYVAQAEGTVRYPMTEGLPFDFLPNDGTIVKGMVKRADGTGIKTGTYATAEGLEIVVAPGGKATIKEVDLT